MAKKSEIVVSEFKDTKKPGKVFADYLQNSPLRTMVIKDYLRMLYRSYNLARSKGWGHPIQKTWG